MPYSGRQSLPQAIQINLPKHGQEIYLKAYNSAWDNYKNAKDRKYGSSREETAHRVAWSAVKQSYTKNSKGNWHKKED